MDTQKEKSNIKTLDWIQDAIECRITNWDLLEVEDVFYEEKDSVVRVFTFSRGQREYLVVIDPRFHIAGISSKVDSNLMTQIYNVLNGLTWQIINGGLAVNKPFPLPKCKRYS